MMENVDCKVIGVIPARFGSSRFPGKPLAPIAGKTLIRRTFENARHIRGLDEVVVATDDPRIARHVEEFGCKAFMTSPHCRTGTDRIAEVVEIYYPEAEIVVNIQGDEPLLNPRVVEILVGRLVEDPEAVVATAATEIDHPPDIFDPSVVKCVMDQKGHALYFSRSPIPFPGEMKATYYRHLGVYAFRKEFLLRYKRMEPTPLQQAEDLEQLKVLEQGHPVHVSIVEESGVGVDSPEDIKRVEALLCQENTSSSLAASSHP